MSSQNDIVQEGKLLSEQERVAFKMISTGNDLHGQRAIALLAIDGGATQAEAGRQAGLTPGQVKYWLGKFRQVRMQIFPAEVLRTEQPGQEPKNAPKSGKSKKSEEAKAKKNKMKPGKKSKTKQGKKSKKGKGAKNKSKGKGKDKKKKAKQKES
jgi:transposase-like protein